MTSDAPGLSEETVAAVRGLLERYPTRRAALLPALHLAQRQIGYLPPKAQAQVAELLELNPAEVLDVVSFYEMFWQRPKGQKLIQVCESFCCELCGHSGLLEALQARLGIAPGQTTPDGRFTLMAVPCLAACDMAPVVMVDERLYERMTPERLDEIFK